MLLPLYFDHIIYCTADFYSKESSFESQSHNCFAYYNFPFLVTKLCASFSDTKNIFAPMYEQNFENVILFPPSRCQNSVIHASKNEEFMINPLHQKFLLTFSRTAKSKQQETWQKSQHDDNALKFAKTSFRIENFQKEWRAQMKRKRIIHQVLW